MLTRYVICRYFLPSCYLSLDGSVTFCTVQHALCLLELRAIFYFVKTGNSCCWECDKISPILNLSSQVIYVDPIADISIHRCSPLALNPRRRSLNSFCKLIPLRKPARARTGIERTDCRSHCHERTPCHNDVIRLVKRKGAASTHPRSIYWIHKCHLGQYKALSIKQMLLGWWIWLSNALSILASLLVLFFLLP